MEAREAVVIGVPLGPGGAYAVALEAYCQFGQARSPLGRISTATPNANLSPVLHGEGKVVGSEKELTTQVEDQPQRSP